VSLLPKPLCLPLHAAGELLNQRAIVSDHPPVRCNPGDAAECVLLGGFSRDADEDTRHQRAGYIRQILGG
jgi:hypothetical protein